MPSDDPKVEFGSNGWIEAARRALESLVATYGEPGVSFSLCEVFTDAPTHLAATGVLVWHFYIDGKTVKVASGEIDDATVKLRTDYQGVLPQARLFYTPEILEQRAQQEPGANFDSVEGDLSLTPLYITELHNQLAVLTA